MTLRKKKSHRKDPPRKKPRKRIFFRPIVSDILPKIAAEKNIESANTVPRIPISNFVAPSISANCGIKRSAIRGAPATINCRVSPILRFFLFNYVNKKIKLLPLTVFSQLYRSSHTANWHLLQVLRRSHSYLQEVLCY